MLFFISFADGVEVQPWRVFEARLPSLAAALRIQAVCCWARMHRCIMLLHRHFHKIIAAIYRGIALRSQVCDFHLQPRILPAKQLHLLGVRCSTLLRNVQHEPH